MKPTLVVTTALLATATAFAGALSAQGSSINQQSACVTGRAGTGVADPCTDGSAIFYNPAALAMQPSMLGVSVIGIRTKADFLSDRGNDFEGETETRPVPNAWASYRVSDWLAAGLGVWAPYGLAVEWPLEFEGRFAAYESSLRNIFIQPTVAVALAPWLSVGGGVDYIRSSVEIKQRVDFAGIGVPGTPFTFANFGIPPRTDVADLTLEGDGDAWTWHIALLAELTPQLSFGFRYLHSADVEYQDGTAAFEQVGPTGLFLTAGNPFQVPIPAGQRIPAEALLADAFADGGPLSEQSVSTALELPNQAVVGVRFQPIEQLKLLGEYQFIGWKTFDVSRIDFERATDADLVLDYQDTDTYRLGAELAATDALDLRAGFRYNRPAERDASVSPLLPEAERQYYTGGLGYRLGDRLQIDLAYQYINQADRRGRVVGRTSVEQTAEELNEGVYSVDAQAFGIGLSYRFGTDR